MLTAFWLLEGSVKDVMIIHMVLVEASGRVGLDDLLETFFAI